MSIQKNNYNYWDKRSHSTIEKSQLIGIAGNGKDLFRYLVGGGKGWYDPIKV